MRGRPGRARDSTPPSVVMVTGRTREKPSRVRDGGGPRSVSGVALVGSRSLVGPKNSRIEAVVEYHLSSSPPPPPLLTTTTITILLRAAGAAAVSAAVVAATAAVVARRCEHATEGRHYYAYTHPEEIHTRARARNIITTRKREPRDLTLI